MQSFFTKSFLCSALILVANLSFAATDCSSEHIKEARKTFQNEYNKNHYELAYDNLNSFLDNCNNKIESSKLLWMQNDLLLTAIKLGNTSECNLIIFKIKNNDGFSKTTPFFQKSVNKNSELCLNLKNPAIRLDDPRGDKEYSWLENDSSLTQTMSIKRLIHQTLPEQAFAKYWISEVSLIDNAEFKRLDDKYVLLKGWVLRDFELKSFILVNVKEGTSIAGIYDTKQGSLHLTSKNYIYQSLPFQARQHIKNYVSSLRNHATEDYDLTFFNMPNKRLWVSVGSMLNEKPEIVLTSKEHN